MKRSPASVLSCSTMSLGLLAGDSTGAGAWIAPRGQRNRIALGFSLVELLVVIGVIAVVIGMLLPSLNKARSQSKAVVCMSNMRQLSLGIVMYATDYKGWAPGWNWEFPDPGGPTWSSGSPPDANGMDYKSKGGWNFNFSGSKCVVTPWLLNHNFFQQGLVWKYVKSEAVYLCPEYPSVIDRQGMSGHALAIYGFDPQWTYELNASPGVSGAGVPYSVRVSKIKPSPSTVILLFEPDPNDNRAWSQGVVMQDHVTYVASDNSVGSLHNHGGNMSFYDGHVEFLTHKEYVRRASAPGGLVKIWGGAIGIHY